VLFSIAISHKYAQTYTFLVNWIANKKNLSINADLLCDCENIYALQRFMCSQKRTCAASVPISTFVYLWAIYILPRSVQIFHCSRIGRPIPQRHMNVEVGLWPRNSFSGNICFEFSVLCVCSGGQKVKCELTVEPALQMKSRSESNINVCSHLCIPRNITLFPKQNYNVLSPSSYTHLSVRDLYISGIGLPILLQGNMRTDPRNTYKSLTVTWMWNREPRPRNSQERNT
jgi:hypothetical protein